MNFNSNELDIGRAAEFIPRSTGGRSALGITGSLVAAWSSKTLRPARHEESIHTRSIPADSMNEIVSRNPTPVLRFENTNGRLPRIFRASRSITSSDAPTYGARSILLMTSRSDFVIPGPPLRGW
jgi:hypothetical protein